MRFTSATPPTRVRLTSATLSAKARLTSVTPPTEAGLTSATPLTRVGLVSPAPPTRVKFTSTTLPTSGLISAAPPTEAGLTSATPLTRVGLVSPTPSTRMRFISAAPPTKIRPTSVGLFSAVTFIMAKIDTTVTFLGSQNAPLSFIMRIAIKIHFLVHLIMTSPSKTAGATPFTAAFKAYLLAVIFSPQSRKNTLQISSKK